MTDLEDLIKINREIVKHVDELLESGDWNASLFLKVAGKQLYKLRVEAESLVEEGMSLKNAKGADESQKSQKPPLKEDEVELFISLYQSQGTALDKWEETLRTLGGNSVGRPIYDKEAHVIKAIHARGDLFQEGYASVYIKRSDIITVPESRESYDRFGHLLLSLNDQAVLTQNIHEFVHANQKHYRFKEGKLILLGYVSDKEENLQA